MLRYSLASKDVTYTFSTSFLFSWKEAAELHKIANLKNCNKRYPTILTIKPFRNRAVSRVVETVQ